MNGEIEAAARILDQYYIAPRCPDALPDGIPSEFFTEEQAGAAQALAEKVLELAEHEFTH